MAGLVSGQWALNETATLFADMLKASTSDLIQPSALLVGELFGAKLAMSQTTRLRLETTSKSPHLHRTVTFLKSTIGYAKGDSFDYLVSSNGGIRFLSLVSALLCTSSSWFAACTLYTMIHDTAPTDIRDDPTMPTERMLHDLLNALDPRLCRIGFANYVSGFQSSLGKLCSIETGDKHPSAGMIIALVDAFRHIDRLGESEAGDTVQIWAHAGIPWIAAFTQWTVNEHPSVIAANGKALIEASSRVSIFVNESASKPEEVKIFHKIDKPNVLWSGPVGESAAWSGMISIKDYGRHQMRNFGLDSDKARNVLREVLPVSIGMAIKRLFPTRLSRSGHAPFHPALVNENQHSRGPPRFELIRFRSQMFGKPRKLKSALETYLGKSVAYDFTTSSETYTQQFPSLESYLEALIAQCGCKICHPELSDDEDSRLSREHHKPGAPTELPSLYSSTVGQNAFAPSEQCMVMRFWARLSFMTTEILTISLFDCTQDIQLFWPGEAASLNRIRSKFAESVYQCVLWMDTRFRRFDNYFCSTAEVLTLAASLIGHKVSREIESGTWIASADRGQVIYPSIFDLGIIDSNPLSLGGGPGQLIFQNSKVGKIVSKSPPESLTPSTKLDILESPPVNGILNLYQDDELDWRVSATGDAPEISFGSSHSQKIYNPHNILLTISRSLFVDCSHYDDMAPSSRSIGNAGGKDEVPTAIQECCVFTKAPFYMDPEKESNLMDERKSRSYYPPLGSVDYKTHTLLRTHVFPTTGNEDMRLFAMCSPFPGVVRNNACLQCCVDVCHKAGLNYIVL